MIIRNGLLALPTSTTPSTLFLEDEYNDGNDGELVYSPVEEVLGLDVLPVLLQVHPCTHNDTHTHPLIHSHTLTYALSDTRYTHTHITIAILLLLFNKAIKGS